VIFERKKQKKKKKKKKIKKKKKKKKKKKNAIHSKGLYKLELLHIHSGACAPPAPTKAYDSVHHRSPNASAGRLELGRRTGRRGDCRRPAAAVPLRSGLGSARPTNVLLPSGWTHGHRRQQRKNSRLRWVPLRRCGRLHGGQRLAIRSRRLQHGSRLGQGCRNGRRRVLDETPQHLLPELSPPHVACTGGCGVPAMGVWRLDLYLDSVLLARAVHVVLMSLSVACARRVFMASALHAHWSYMYPPPAPLVIGLIRSWMGIYSTSVYRQQRRGRGRANMNT